MVGYAGNLISFNDRHAESVRDFGTIADGPVHPEVRPIAIQYNRCITGRFGVVASQRSTSGLISVSAESGSPAPQEKLQSAIVRK